MINNICEVFFSQVCPRPTHPDSLFCVSKPLSLPSHSQLLANLVKCLGWLAAEASHLNNGTMCGRERHCSAIRSLTTGSIIGCNQLWQWFTWGESGSVSKGCHHWDRLRGCSWNNGSLHDHGTDSLGLIVLIGALTRRIHLSPNYSILFWQHELSMINAQGGTTGLAGTLQSFAKILAYACILVRCITLFFTH